MEKEKLDEMLNLHKLWLNDEPNGKCADLRSADLSFANLSFADLRNANLIDADLRSADLRSAVLFCEGVTSKTIHQIQGLFYHVYLLDSHIKIGCEIHTIEKWRNFNDAEINTMDMKALEFWKQNKKFIMAFYERDAQCGK